jgi:Rps23 Pro-64 3,4-dihydroxylase Tpa1-like proline 4-hydroxylase
MTQSLNFIELRNGVFPVIDNFYTQEELTEIKNELYSLYEIAKLGIYENSLAAFDENENKKQKSVSLFLDDLYNNKRHLSKILTINRKLFNSDLSGSLVNKNIFYSYLKTCNYDFTLINFYKANDYYNEHKDNTCLTALTFFELEKFSGGNLYFPEHDKTIEAVDNRLVIFPGFMLHAAQEVTQGIRVSMAQFLKYK